MRINTNISALMANREMEKTTKAIARSMERLSTGLRASTARDDASGIARGVGLEAQVRSLSRSILNINESFGVLQTADASISTQLDIVQRMREIAVQSSSGTLSVSDRTNLNAELQSLYKEYQRIVSQTDFNGVKLLDGSFGTKSIQAGTQALDTIQFGLTDLNAEKVFTKTTGSGTFSTRVTYSSNATPGGNDAADFNGDGILDLVAANTGSNTVSVMLSNSAGTYGSPTTYTVGTAPAMVTTGDLRGIGRKDIVSADYTSGTASILLSNGDGTFKTRTTVALGTGIRKVILADMNNDGKLDLMGSGDNANLAIALGNGDGTFKTATTATISAAGNYELAAVDMNNDGKLDIVSTSTSTNQISLLIGNGDGTFQNRTTIGLAFTARGLAVADYNADGMMDIAVGGGTTVAVYRGTNGSAMSSFSLIATLSAASSLNGLMSADLDGDGSMDLIANDRGAGTGTSIVKWMNNGDGTFQGRSTLTVGTDPRYFTIADLRGRGVYDIISSDYGNATVSILYGVAATTSATNKISVSTQSKARDLLTVLDAAIENLALAKSKIGSQQSRFEFAKDTATITKENLASGKAQIMDVDIASETAELVRMQILNQAQASVFAQANLQLQMILDLLKY
ncbi:MAG: VCBS repeat-containing protein [Deltaproteobacteria bacterium]|nr:VCBS repeat-containing protein [Deltaproteobacteria bacterium]